MTKWMFASAFAAIVAAAACTEVGSCPPAESITPGAACSGDQLECPYTLQTASPACDGTTVDGGIATSCVCTSGTWACPTPVSCPAAGGTSDGGVQEAPGDDGGTSTDGAADGEVQEASGDGGIGSDGAIDGGG